MSDTNLLYLLEKRGCNPGRQVSGKHGGQFNSACPACGGKDRFICWPYEQRERCIGAYHCSSCEISGDTIEFLRKFCDMTFKEAMEAVGNTVIDQKHYNPAKNIVTTPFEIPSKTWRENALAFTKYAHEQILGYPDVVSYLAGRGIIQECINKFNIGFCPAGCNINREDWGLGTELNEHGSPKSIWIPRGITIPTIDTDGTVLRLKIRKDGWREGDGAKYINISNNMKIFSTYGDRNKSVMIIVESELDAITIAFYAGNFAFAASAGSNTTNPDPMTRYLADNAQYLLICHDNDAAGRKMRDKWIALYPKAHVCPAPNGKDIGEAYAKGMDIESWLYAFLVGIGCKTARQRAIIQCTQEDKAQTSSDEPIVKPVEIKQAIETQQVTIDTDTVVNVQQVDDVSCQYIYGVLDEGGFSIGHEFDGRCPVWQGVIPKEWVDEDYVKWCKKNRKKIDSRESLDKSIKDLLPSMVIIQHSNGQILYKFPSLRQTRSEFREFFNIEPGDAFNDDNIIEG